MLQEADRRLAAAETDEDFEAVRTWLIEDQNVSRQFANDYVMVPHLTHRGENLPY